MIVVAQVVAVALTLFPLRITRMFLVCRCEDDLRCVAMHRFEWVACACMFIVNMNSK